MRQSYIKWSLVALMAGIAVLFLDALYLEKYFFQVRRFSIGKKNGSRKIRIILLTDLHFVKYFHSYHRKLAKKINDLNPDLILVSGDIIDQFGDAAPARRFFDLLPPSVPLIAIPGNHDHKNKVSKGTLKKILEQHNGQLLVNETKQVQAGGVQFTITGLDDFIEGKSRFADAVKNVEKEEHHLLLLHSPLQQEQVLKELHIVNNTRPSSGQLTISYIFAGHNHGGQVRLGPLVPVLPEQSGNYVDGWYNHNKPYLYVSKGFGTSALPLRFCARSEITVFEYGT